MKKTVFSEIMLIVTALALISGLVSFAWLSKRWETNDYNAVSFKAGKINLPKLTMWIYDTKEEGATSPGWREYYSDADAADASVKKSIVPFAMDNNGTVTPANSGYELNLHFGQVTSLVEKTDENDIYFRFDINADELTDNGFTSIDIDYHYCSDTAHSGNPVDVYKYVSSSQNYQLVANTLPSLTGLVDASYAVSTSKYSMTESSGVTGIKALFEGNSATATELASGTLAQPSIPTLSENDTAICIYVKLSLNRTELREVLADLNEFMPCFLIFNIYLGVGATPLTA